MRREEFRSQALQATATGQWSPTASLATARFMHTATLLPSGKVLVIGGKYEDTTYDRAEVYDSGVGRFTVAGTLAHDRQHHTATLMLDGDVLVAGGHDSSGVPLASAEVYNPERAPSTGREPLRQARSHHTVTLLVSGKVLVAGGQGSSGSPLVGAEVYDPSTGQWTTTGPMNQARSSHTATLLPGGKVLVAGGQGSSGPSLGSAELYDPSSGQWTTTGPMNQVRSSHTATLLPGGKVLVAGGDGPSPLLRAEVYDPMTGQWAETGSLIQARSSHTATPLPGGEVLVAGGQDASGVPLTHVEVYEPMTEQWAGTRPLNQARSSHTATLLPGGEVLVAGGQGASTTPLTHAEVYDPGTGRWTSTGSMTWARVNRSTATLLTNGQVLITGGGNTPAEVYEDSEARQEWRSKIHPLGAPLRRNNDFSIRGSGLRGISEASSGTTQSSATDYPLVSLLAVEGGALTRLVHHGSFSHTEGLLQVPATVPNGHYTLSVMINAIHHGQVVTVQGPGPSAPKVDTPGGYIQDKKPDIGGRAEAGSRVAVWLDGTATGTAVADANGNWRLEAATELGDGFHRVKAIARDAAGNVSPPSEDHVFTVDTQEPEAPEVLSPGRPVSTRRPAIVGRAEAGSMVTVWVDGTEAGTAVADAKGNWSLTVAEELRVGPHKVNAKAQDAAGNLSEFSADHHFIVQVSHYGWNCAAAPALPAAWALLALALWTSRASSRLSPR